MIQRRTTATLLIFGLAIVAVFGLIGQFSDAATESFPVTLDITNVAPTITNVETPTYTPVADSTTSFQFYFNASDDNGAADLDTDTASVIIELGAQTATSSGCTVEGTDGNERRYNCTVDIPYYFDASSSWSINASIEDNQGSYVENLTETFTLNEVRAIALTEDALSYSGTPGQSDIAAAEGAQVVRNTGNYDFPGLNLTAFNLQGDSSGEIIGAGNFTVNVSDDPTGQTLLHNQVVQITDADMTHGQDANETLYVHLDIPAGVVPDEYNSTSDWVIDA